MSVPPGVPARKDAPRPDAETLRRIIARVAGRSLPSLADITPPLASIVMRLAGEIARQDADLEVAFARAAELADLADHDPLLALLNRRGFERELARTAAIVERYRTPASVVFVGRLGGDEFAVILVQADREAARIKAERLEAIIATTPIDIDGTTILLTASTGSHEITGSGELKKSLDAADAAMYRRKAEYHAGDTR